MGPFKMTEVRQARFPHLFEPIALSGRRLRNRIVALSTVTNFNRGGHVTKDYVAYLSARAAGGAAAIVTEGFSVHPSSAPNPYVIALHDPEVGAGLARLADVVEGHDCRLIGQLWHVGRQQLWSPLTTPLGVSHLPDAMSWAVPHVMNEDDIKGLVRAFIDSAVVLQRAGFSGAEIHGAHGYLITQFLSPYSNVRDDGYGGDRLGRMRFLREIVAGIRDTCGDDFILGVKLPADEGVDGGIDLAEARGITTQLAADGGLDYAAYSQGNFSYSLERHVPDMHFPPAPYAAQARELMGVAGDMKVLVMGRITSAAHAEDLLATGHGALVGLARPLIADPTLPAKAAEGDTRQVRPCVHSNQCWGAIVDGAPISCPQNVRLRTADETAPWMKRADASRKVVVVGTGPAGLEAAWLAAAAGHDVALHGASAQLGGKMRLESLLPGRANIGKAIRFQAERLAEFGVSMTLGKTMTPDILIDSTPDAVIVATGASMQPPTLTPDSEGMVALWDIVEKLISDKRPRSGTAVLFDHDQTAAVYAAAELMAKRFENVILATPAMQIARTIPYVSAIGVHRRIAAAGVKVMIGSLPTAWRAGRLDIQNLFTGRVTPIDDVTLAIYATPRRATDGLARPLRDAGIEVHVIGDAYAPRGHLAAMVEARGAAEAL
jgi:2,4-dienoyl-CoA reductase-like NADH-dependent reductase (Old Yellow Enzyme family)